MILGTAGHIDHGKTALVHALTGVDTDRLPEERRRGISIELGFAPLTLDDGSRVSVVDVPGHERFVRTMIAGASGIDAALLVVAADEGVKPQTREHCAILRALAVRVVVIAVTKTDRVHASALPRILDSIRDALQSFGVDATVPAVGVSALTGEGTPALRTALASGVTSIAERDSRDLFRFVVDRAFTLRGTGTVVTGSVWSGTAAAGDRVRALPDGRTWRVRGVHSHGAVVERASAGERIALALADAAPHDILRGATLVTDDEWRPTRRVAVHVDAGSDELPRRFDVQLGGTVVSAGWSASPSAAHVVRLSLDAPLVARAGDRIVLRARPGADGILGATIVDPTPDRIASTQVGAPIECVLHLTRAAAARGVSLASLPIRIGVSPRAVHDIVAHHELVVLGERVFHRDALTQLADRVVAVAEETARDEPFGDGSPEAALRGAVKRAVHADDLGVDAAISAAIASGRLMRRGDHLSWSAAVLDAADAELLSHVAGWIERAGLEAPTLTEVAAQFGPESEGAVRYWERRGNLIRVGGVRYCAAPVVAAAIARLREVMVPGREYTPSELRGVLGVSRKYLVPLLEYCDAERVTVRYSGGRVLVDVSSR